MGKEMQETSRNRLWNISGSGELIDMTKRILEANGLLQAKDLPLEIINNRFSSDNGEALLKPWFGRVEIPALASCERNDMTISKYDRIFICSLPRHGGVEP